MSKLTLKLETLGVEPFEAASASRRSAQAADGSTIPPYCFTFTCGDSHVRPCLAGG